MQHKCNRWVKMTGDMQLRHNMTSGNIIAV